MSHSRTSNPSDDLEHLELTQELLAAHADDSPPHRQPAPSHPPPSSNKHARRVSINSLGSNASSSTVKQYSSQEPTHSQGAPGAGSSGTGTLGSRPPSSAPTSYASALKRPKSYRHSSALLAPETASPSGSRRRRPAAGRKPGSSRSSIRQRNRSSDEDEDEDEDEDLQEETGDYFNQSHASHGRLRRASSRRSTRLSPGGEHEDHGREHYDRHSGEDDDDDRSDAEPLTLKDRQEVIMGCFVLFLCVCTVGTFFASSPLSLPIAPSDRLSSMPPLHPFIVFPSGALAGAVEAMIAVTPMMLAIGAVGWASTVLVAAVCTHNSGRGVLFFCLVIIGHYLVVCMTAEYKQEQISMCRLCSCALTTFLHDFCAPVLRPSIRHIRSGCRFGSRLCTKSPARSSAKPTRPCTHSPRPTSTSLSAMCSGHWSLAGGWPWSASSSPSCFI